MCGIAGKFNTDLRPVKESEIIEMTGAIAHRGPDDEGIFIFGHAGIGFRRLSIIDVKGGRQPIENEDGQVVAATNGEIYNFQELRDLLISKGHRFRTGSDVEVVIHLYEEYGDGFAHLLNGMFAIALYDKRKDRMLLLRDRMGVKPLYYQKNGNSIFFASEIKGIIASNEARREKEDSVFDEYILFRFLAEDRTFFKDVRSLSPGTLCVIDRRGIVFKKYSGCVAESWSGDAGQLTADILASITESVKMQLMSDVPMGTLLSGGVDSSLVTALASRELPGIDSFTVGFEENEYDESLYAKAVSEKFGTRYNELKVSGREFAENLSKAVWFHDEPLNHANSVQLYMVSKLARKSVKVLLTGEGADEVFGGYPRYYINRLADRTHTAGSDFLRVSAGALSLLGFRKASKLSDLVSMNPERMIIMNSAFINKPYKISLDLDAALRGRTAVLEGIGLCGGDSINRLLFYEQKTYLQSVLNRADKMSMAASVEARVPFLENRTVALVNSISGRNKIKKFSPKYLLKQAAKKVLPGSVVDRKKVGFGSPIGKWLRDPRGLGRFLDGLTESAEISSRVGTERLRRLITEHRSAEADHSDILWPMINYSVWEMEFFRK